MASDTSRVLNFKCGNLDIQNLNEIRAYAKDLVDEAEELVTKFIPAKIFELDKLCKKEIFAKKSPIDVAIDVPSNGMGVCSPEVEFDVKNLGKKRKFDEGKDVSSRAAVPVNSNLTPLIEAIKPEVRELIQTCTKVQLWIQLLIPKIEDGNNFGVSIQEEILSEVNRIQTEATSYLDQISRYYITRGKLLSKIAKYPFLDDYRQVIKEVDEKQYISLQLNCFELRNFYILLLDSISKNYEKIKKPRSSNTETMY